MPLVCKEEHMTVQPIWEENTTVRVFEVDFQQRWKPAAFFQAMQEAGSHHAQNLGFDYQELMSRQMIWVMARARVIFQRFPLSDEPVIVRTWPKGIRDKILFLRDYQLFDQHRQLLASATTVFLLIHLQSHRILSPDLLTRDIPLNQDLHAIQEIPQKISPPAEMSERFTLTAGYSDLDILGHVNNARYVEWITDAFSMQQYQAQQINWLQINFLHEVREGDQLLISTHQLGSDLWYVQGWNETQNESAFDSIVQWAKK